MTAQPANIRLGRAADIPRLIAIRGSVLENRLSDPGSIAAADYEAYIRSGRLWVAEAADGAVVGFASLDSETGSVWALFVAPAAEGKGVGRQLLACLVADARRLGLRVVSLETEAGSRAERLYRAAGWRVTGNAEQGMLRMECSL